MYFLCVTRDFSNANKLEVSFITFLLPKYEHEKLCWQILTRTCPKLVHTVVYVLNLPRNLEKMAYQQ